MVLAIAPVLPKWSDEFSGYLYFGLGMLGLYAGFSAPDVLGIKTRPIYFSDKAIRRTVLILAAAGLLGSLFKIYDVVVLRSVDFQAVDAMAAREQLARASQSNVFSLAAAALVPLGNAALAMAFYGRATGALRKAGTFVWLSAMMPTAIPLLLASRSALFALLCFLVAIVLNVAPRITVRHIAIAVAGAFAASFLFAFLLLLRVEQVGASIAYSARYSVYTYVVPLTPWAASAIDDGGVFSRLLAAYASLMQYGLSGFFEFLLLVDLKGSDFGYGGYTASFVPKLIAIITQGNGRVADVSYDLLNPRAGVFQSFFGPLYIDFGFMLVLPCFVFGVAIAILRAGAKNGNIFAIPGYFFMLAQLMVAMSFPSLILNAAIITNCLFLIIYFFGRFIGSEDPSIAERE